MAKHTIKSSNIKSLSYDKALKALDVEFVGGNTYRYTKVPEALFKSLLAENERVLAGSTDASVGKKFVSEVRNNQSFKYEKVAP